MNAFISSSRRLYDKNPPPDRPTRRREARKNEKEAARKIVKVCFFITHVMKPSLFERFGIRFYVAFEVHVVAFFYTSRVQVVADF